MSHRARAFAKLTAALKIAIMSAGFGIYVHWPFCAAKCPYCDFNSHVRAQFDDMDWARGDRARTRTCRARCRAMSAPSCKACSSAAARRR